MANGTDGLKYIEHQLADLLGFPLCGPNCGLVTPLVENHGSTTAKL